LAISLPPGSGGLNSCACRQHHEMEHWERPWSCEYRGLVGGLRSLLPLPRYIFVAHTAHQWVAYGDRDSWWTKQTTAIVGNRVKAFIVWCKLH